MDNELLNNYLKGVASDKEKSEVLKWIEASAENRKYFMQIRRLYDISIWYEQKDSVQNEGSEPLKPRFTLGQMKDWVRMVVIVAITIVGTILVQKITSDPTITYQTIEVSRGQHANITLADGIKVSLNSNSKLEFPSNFQSGEHTVKLDGEGFFKVTHNKDLPFHILTQKCDIRVLEAKFNVLAYNNSDIFETSLFEGSVQVSDLKSSQKILLKPNQKVQMQKGKLIASAMNPDGDLPLCNGLYVFNNEPLIVVFKKLEQYYQLKIVVQNKSINSLRFTGKFRQQEDIESIVKALQKSNNFHYKRNEKDNSIIIF